jgi:hypothetical protein
MIFWLLAAALASTADTTHLGEIVMPLTPSEGHDTYVGVFDHTGASAKSWVSDTPGFACEPRGDLLEVVVRKASWPREVPKKVTCTADDNKKVKAPVRVVARKHVAMFIADGTLLMPRAKNASVNFKGAPPQADLIVQQGQTGSLTIRCDVEPGPVLEVVVDAETPDSDGMCALKTKAGQVVRVPIKVVTAR